MKDFLDHTIHLGDKIVYVNSTHSGGVEMHKHIVIGLTPNRVVVPVQRSFGRKVKYVKPKNCVIYKWAKDGEDEPDQC